MSTPSSGSATGSGGSPRVILSLLGILTIIGAGTAIYFASIEGNPTKGVTAALLAVLAAGALLALYATPSGKWDLNPAEGFLGVGLLLIGALMGSSQMFYPYMNAGWTKVGLGASVVDPIAPPTVDKWELTDMGGVKKLLPTTKLEKDLQLVALLPKAGHGVIVPKDGIVITDEDNTEVFVRHRVDGRTSSSVALK